MQSDNFREQRIGLYLKGSIKETKSGAYGIVYIIDRGKNVYPRYAAYKTTKEEYDESRIEAFIREIKIWFDIKGYALILPPFFVKHFENRPLICMLYCEKSLRDYLEEKEKLEPIEALVIVAQILKGLIFAKSKGIEAHQDLKPENILLEDLGKKFVDWPPEGLYLFKWRVRIADFGSANAWRELGKPGGTKPYMAPEQWKLKRLLDQMKREDSIEHKKRIMREIEKEKKETNFSKVDVFAVGIIFYELLTGKHPKTQSREEWYKELRKAKKKGKWSGDKKWKSWATDTPDNVKIENGALSGELEGLIKEMLRKNVEERISIEQAFYKVMDVLKRADKSVANQLELLFEYYDTLARYDEDEVWLNSLVEIAKLPGLLDVVVGQFLEEISKIEKCVDSPDRVTYFCELCYITSKFLLRRKKSGDVKKAKDLAMKILSTAVKWQKNIRTHHKYPELKFKESILIPSPSFRDFEVYAELIGYSRKLLEKLQGKEETKRIFEKLDNYTRSAYYYDIASEYHLNLREQYKETVGMLDKCIELNPEEAVFYYMKALWTDQYLSLMGISEEKLKEEEKRVLREFIVRNAEIAAQLAPDWEEPRNLLKSFRV